MNVCLNETERAFFGTATDKTTVLKNYLYSYYVSEKSCLDATRVIYDLCGVIIKKLAFYLHAHDAVLKKKWRRLILTEKCKQ